MKYDTQFKPLFNVLAVVSAIVFFMNAGYILHTLAAERIIGMIYFLIGLLVILWILKKFTPNRFYLLGGIALFLFLVLHSGFVYQEHAYGALALTLHKIVFCNKAYCPECCVNEFDLAQYDVSVCDPLKYELGDFCRMQFAVMRNDVSLCDERWKKEMGQNNCFINLAVQNKDVTYCAHLIDEQGFNRTIECYRDVAMAKKDIELCRRATTSIYRDECLNVIAILLGNKTLCNEIQTDWKKKDCLIRIEPPPNVIIDKLFPCTALPFMERETCLHTMAVKQHDPTICNHIIWEWKERRCKDAATT